MVSPGVGWVEGRMVNRASARFFKLYSEVAVQVKQGRWGAPRMGAGARLGRACRLLGHSRAPTQHNIPGDPRTCTVL